MGGPTAFVIAVYPDHIGKKRDIESPVFQGLYQVNPVLQFVEPVLLASSLRHTPPRIWLVVFIMKADKISGRRGCDTVCSCYYAVYSATKVSQGSSILSIVYSSVNSTDPSKYSSNQASTSSDW